jgi:hypothetical protein
MPSVRIDHQGRLVEKIIRVVSWSSSLTVFRLSGYKTRQLDDYLGFGLGFHPHSFYSVDPLNLLDTLDHFVKVV